jgi:hypothetical protein
MTEGSPSPGELAHYGVKGMKWGVRRAALNKASKDYTPGMRDIDKHAFGERGVKRINRRMNKGQTRKQALGREAVRATSKHLLVSAGTLAAMAALGKHGDDIAGGLSKLGETSRGKAAAGKTFATNAAGRGMERFGPNQKTQVRGVQMRVNTTSSYDD